MICLLGWPVLCTTPRASPSSRTVRSGPLSSGFEPLMCLALERHVLLGLHFICFAANITPLQFHSHEVGGVPRQRIGEDGRYHSFPSCTRMSDIEKFGGLLGAAGLARV